MSALVLDLLAVAATVIMVALLVLRAAGVFGHRPVHRPSPMVADDLPEPIRKDAPVREPALV